MTTNEGLSLLAAADPAHDAELMSPDAPGSRALKEQILRAEIAAPARRRPARRLIAAGIVVVAVAVTGMLPRALERDPVGATPAAAAVLERAAAATTRIAQTTAGRYAYTEARIVVPATGTDDPPFTALIPGVQETWLARDGSGRVRTVHGTPYFPSERDRSRWLAHGSPAVGAAPGTVTVERRAAGPAAIAAIAERDPALLDPRELDELLNTPTVLPTDTGRLERVLRAYALTKDPPPESMMFDQLEDLLTNPYGSGALRAAAYRVLARMNGVELRGPTHDPAGRRGTAIDFPAGYTGVVRRRLIIDPATGAVLAEQTLLAEPNDEVGGRPGEILAQVVYLRSGWVDAVGARS